MFDYIYLGKPQKKLFYRCRTTKIFFLKLENKKIRKKRMTTQLERGISGRTTKNNFFAASFRREGFWDEMTRKIKKSFNAKKQELSKKTELAKN